MKIIQYTPNSTVDGIGVRQVWWTAGCEHHCKGCHNPQTWNFDAGIEMETFEIVSKTLASPHNVTFSGGDPFYQAKELLEVLTRIGHRKTVWVYTGFTFEEILENPEYSKLLPYIDVLVDGPFVMERRNEKLQFRGSSNQRIIDVPKSMITGEVELWREGQYI